MASRLLFPGRARAPVFVLALVLAPSGAWAQADVRADADPAAAATSTPTSAPSTPTPPPPSAQAASTAAPAPTSSPADADLPALDEVVVVGRRPRGQVARDPTASATVIDAGRFAGEAKNVAELVATAPGVAVSEYGGLGHLATVSLRGATADGVLVLVDGLPLNTAAGGPVDLASIPRQWIDRIEIVRGVEGAAYGAGALGGVVNVVTRPGGGAPSAELAAGSYGTYAASADASAGGPAAWVTAGATAETSSGRFTYLFDPQPAIPGSPLVPEVRENNATARGGLLVKGALVSGARRWDALLAVSGGRRELPGWPYQLTPDDRERDGRALGALRLAVPVGGGTTVAARASARGDLLDVERSGTLSRQRGGATTGELEVVQDHRVGVLTARASAGGEQLSADGLDRTRRRATLAASLAEDLRLGPVRIGPAARYDRIGAFDGWSARLGAGVPLCGALALRAAAGRSFRAPSFTELYLDQGVAVGNPDLRPEQGVGADAALVAEGRLGWASVGGHATRYDDLVFYQPASLGRLKPFNSGRSFAGGLEAEAATAPLGAAGLAVEGAYTYLRTEILRGDAATLGKDVPRKPRHRLFARLSATPRAGFGGAHVELHRVGRQYQDALNAVGVPPTTVWNAGAWARLWRRPFVRLAVEVRNLRDDRTLVDPIGNPLPGRTVLVTLRLEPASPKGSSNP